MVPRAISRLVECLATETQRRTWCTRIETEVFGGNVGVSRRIYELSREVIGFQRGTAPLSGMLSNLIEDSAERVDPEVSRYLRDVQDHAIRTIEKAAGFRELLNSILSVNLTLVGLQQNEEVKALYEAAIEQNEEVKALSEASINQNDQVKRISAWAAILFAPTLVGTVYGMNVDYMPELHWTLGYPFALVLMLAGSVSLYVAFKRRGWL